MSCERGSTGLDLENHILPRSSCKKRSDVHTKQTEHHTTTDSGPATTRRPSPPSMCDGHSTPWAYADTAEKVPPRSWTSEALLAQCAVIDATAKL